MSYPVASQLLQPFSDALLHLNRDWLWNPCCYKLTYCTKLYCLLHIFKRKNLWQETGWEIWTLMICGYIQTGCTCSENSFIYNRKRKINIQVYNDKSFEACTDKNKKTFVLTPLVMLDVVLIIIITELLKLNSALSCYLDSEWSLKSKSELNTGVCSCVMYEDDPLCIHREDRKKSICWSMDVVMWVIEYGGLEVRGYRRDTMNSYAQRGGSFSWYCLFFEKPLSTFHSSNDTTILTLI